MFNLILEKYVRKICLEFLAVYRRVIYDVLKIFEISENHEFSQSTKKERILILSHDIPQICLKATYVTDTLCILATYLPSNTY